MNEDQLKRDEERLRLQTRMIESSFEPIFLWSFDDGVVEWNQGCERLYGFTRAEAIGRRHYELLRAIYPVSVEEYKEQLATRGEWSGELRQKTKDGRDVVVESRQQLTEANGRRLVLVFNRDITERKVADDRLHESEARFRILADSAPVPIWVGGSDGGFVFANKTFLHFFGNTAVDMEGSGWQSFLHPDDKERYTGCYFKAFNSRAPFLCQGRFLNAEGEYRWLDTSALPRFSASGEFLGYVGASPDITESKRTELNTQFINQLDLALSHITDADAIIRVATGRLGEYLHVARCFVSDIAPETGIGVIREDWEGWLHDASSVAGEYCLDDFTTPELRDVLKAGEVAAVNDVTADQRTRDFGAAYERFAVGAFVSVPMMNETRWEATLNVSHPEARKWRPDEIQVMRDVAARLWPDVKRARAVEALRESEERFRALTNATSDVMYRMSPDWTEMRYLRGREFIADTPEPSRKWVEKYIHPDDRQRVMEVIRHAIQTRSIFELEHRVIRVDGTLGWTYSRAIPILDANGRVIEWFGAASDITQQKQMQQELIESEERARRTLVEQMVAGVYECDAAGKYKLVNQRFCNIVGRTQDELIGMSVKDITCADDWPHNAELFRRLFENGESFFIENLLKDGSEVWVNSHVSPIRNARSEVEGAVAVVVDVTKRKLAERELAAAKDRLAADLTAMTTLQKIGAMFVRRGDLPAALQEIIEAAIAISGADKGNIQLFDAATGTLVIKVQHGFGQQFLDYWNAVEQGMGACGSALQKGERVIVEDVTQSPIFVGTPALDVQLQAGVRAVQSTPVLSRSGQLLAVFSTHYATPGRPDERALRLLDLLARLTADIIERAQTEGALRSAYEEAEAATRAKDEFLAVVSHELRSPLNSILGYVRLLRTRAVNHAELDKALDIIERGGRTQLKLIEDLLDTARIVTGKLKLEVQPVDLISVITAAFDVVRPAAQAKNIRLLSNLNPLAGQVTGDPDRLQQIVWNLLSNAIKFTPENGRVEVVLTRIDPNIAIVVRDTGKGIEPEFLPHIFERFRQGDMSTTRRFGGLGLGLSLVKHLVELHGGTVEAESEGGGKGATFTVRLPLRAVYTTIPEEGAAPAVMIPDRAKLLAGLRTLIVDDEEEVRTLLAMTLQSYGAEAQPAASGKEALELLTRQTPNKRFNVLICDIAMPDEDGYMVMRKVRELAGRQRRRNLGYCPHSIRTRRRPRTRVGGGLPHARRKTGRA